MVYTFHGDTTGPPFLKLGTTENVRAKNWNGDTTSDRSRDQWKPSAPFWHLGISAPF